MRFARHLALRLRARQIGVPRWRDGLVAWLIAAMLLQGWAFAETMAGPLDICQAAPARVDRAEPSRSAPDTAPLQAHDCHQCAVCAAPLAPPPALTGAFAIATPRGPAVATGHSQRPVEPVRRQRARAPPFFV